MKELNFMSFQGLLNDLYYSIDLSHTNCTDISNLRDISITLRDASSNN